jgi:hypothetical protein
MLISLLLARSSRDEPRARSPVRKGDLLRYRTVDLELEAQYRDVKLQLEEYEKSREHEPSGKWNKVCGTCGFVNHEDFRYCESCGTSLVCEQTEESCVCPACSAPVGRDAQECLGCGSRFWSPIIVHSSTGKAGPRTAAGDKDGGEQP